MAHHAMRRTLAALVGLVLAPALGGGAEVAILKSTEVPLWRPALAALRERSPGNRFTEHDLQGDEETARRIVTTLRDHAVLVAVGPLAARISREVAPNVPLVYCMVLEPERLGLIDQPRVGGVILGMPIKNQLAAFRLVNPAATRIGILYSPDELGDYVRQARDVAARLQINLIERPVRSEEELPGALKELLRGQEPVDALWMVTDPLLLWEENRFMIFKAARKAAKPVYGFSAAQVEEGALISHGADLVSVGEQAALLVNRLTGREAGPTSDLLVPKAEIVVNETLAKRLKIRLSKEALQAATKVQ